MRRFLAAILGGFDWKLTFPALCGRTADPADVSGTISGHAEKTASKGHGCNEVTLCTD